MAEISELEDELHEAFVWKNLSITPQQQAELESCLLRVSYKLAQVEKIRAELGRAKNEPTERGDKPIIASWEKMTICMVSDDSCRIKTPDGERCYHYSQIGLADGRGGETKSKELWELLKIFASTGGYIQQEGNECLCRRPRH